MLQRRGCLLGERKVDKLLAAWFDRQQTGDVDKPVRYDRLRYMRAMAAHVAVCRELAKHTRRRADQNTWL